MGSILYDHALQCGGLYKLCWRYSSNHYNCVCRHVINNRERERERRLEAKDAAMGKKSKITRDRDRDISEKVALGMASAGAGRGGEVMYDQRLFNLEKGMDSGFATDDQYNVYDRGLLLLSRLYLPCTDRRRTLTVRCMVRQMSSWRRLGRLIVSNLTKPLQESMKRSVKEMDLLSLIRRLKKLIHLVWTSF